MLDVLFEDNHCLAINKPAGLLSQGDVTGDPTAIDLARDYLKRKYAKPGNVFVAPVHRLDRTASGALLLARTSKAAARLSSQFQAGTIRKLYWAWVEGGPRTDSGVWKDRLWKDTRRNQVVIVEETGREGQEATLKFQVIERRADRSLVSIQLETGRSHQIRVQFASRGCPILGDHRYGSRSLVPALDGKSRIALHSRELGFTHPTRPEVIELNAPVPADWPS